MPEHNNTRVINDLLFVLYLAFFVSLIFAFRAVSSISVALLIVSGIIKNRVEHKGFLNQNLMNPLVFFCGLLFLLQFVSLLYTNDMAQGWKNIRLKSALVVIPLSLCCCDYINETTRPKLLKWYCLILFCACLYAMYYASRRYAATHNSSVLLYHPLVSIYSGHAVQFSILVFISLLHLFEALTKKAIVFTKYADLFLIAFFLVFLFLLSSKLVIAFFLAYFLYTMIKSFLFKSINVKFIVISIISLAVFSLFIFSTQNRISNRFKEIIQTDFHFIKRERFNPGDYFNGLQFRLLQWEFVPGILNEEKAWLMGVSPGDAQNYLNQKYISKNMYTGTVARGDKGFIGYNTHDQFLESLLETGLIGSLLFLLICWSLAKMTWKRKMAELSFVTILLLIYSFSESVFETQYSLFIFLFFPLFFYLSKSKGTN
jgi:O-antigen ligase